MSVIPFVGLALFSSHARLPLVIAATLVFLIFAVYGLLLSAAPPRPPARQPQTGNIATSEPESGTAETRSVSEILILIGLAMAFSLLMLCGC